MPPKKRASTAADGEPVSKKARKPIAETAATARPKRFAKLPPRAARVKSTTAPAPATTRPATPKKRGRPSLNGAQDLTPKKRGRPSLKGAQDLTPKTKTKAASSKSKVAAAKTVTGKPKKRLGRPPKTAIEAIKSARKPRKPLGRPSKLVGAPVKKPTVKRARGLPTASSIGKAAFAHLKEKEPDLTIEVPEDDAYGPDGRSYWLMKAEPESRLVKGVDVKFSIDDLQAAVVPEPWDGVRNPVARNNLRAMKKGDQAFFYHSSCKVPGIVGLMEIVKEHSVDESAFDPAHPYYDEKSSRENPKWEVVHVEFRRKFDNILKLDSLKAHGLPGKPLENLQTLRQSRVSVSRVTPKEWEFIMNLIDPPSKPEEKQETADAAAPATEPATEKETTDNGAAEPENQAQPEGEKSETNDVVDDQAASGESAGIVNGNSTSGPFSALLDGAADNSGESEKTKSKFPFF
ncbi:Thymocyte nuclear protein 1 [Talaromyces islandicus]|uniref:Thymocyte nuclear protein 1 n=1 Tax=Talaromyces islandicus TaxID=28573 RepID=A0A0U1M3D9_TALIS|nr:Thymocyte nuclear protein 1 [Talaromyces islandicus]